MDAASPSRQAGSAVVNLMTLLAQAATPAFHVQLARRLGMAGYGLYTFSNSIVELTSLVTLFGMDNYVTNEVSRAGVHRDVRRATLAVGGALRMVAFTGMAMALLLGLGAPWLGAAAGKPEMVLPLRTLAFVPVVYHLTTMFLVATQARMAMRYDFWTRGIAQPLILFALTTLLLFWGLPGACLAVVLGMGTTTVIAARFYGRELPLGPTLRTALRGPIDSASLRTAAPLVAAGLVWTLQGRLDQFVLGMVRPAEELGAYGACGAYVIALVQVRGVFVPGLTAALPGLLEAGDQLRIRQLVRQGQRWVALLAIPLFVVFLVFGDALLAVFGRGARVGSSALGLLATGHLFGALCLPAYLLLFGPTKQRWISTLGGLSSLVVQVVMLPAMARRWGLPGAAACSALGMLVAQALQQFAVWRIHRVHGFSLGLCKILLSGALAALPGRLVFEWLGGPLVTRFLAGLGCSLVVYVGLVALLRLEPEERAMLTALTKRLRARLRGSPG
jgi:O-antigen/teichoic acid export membrane protein